MIGLMALATATAVPAPVRLFGDWTVACDNIRHCEAVALMPEGEFDGWATLHVERDGGANASAMLTVSFEGAAKFDALSVDGGAAVVRLKSARSGDAPGTVLDAALVARLRNGTFAELRGAGGALVGRASLKGLSAALRYIDDQQKRAGTTTALIATGPAPAARVPTPPPAPVVVRAPAVLAAVPLPPRSVLARLQKAHKCDEAEVGIGNESSANRIDGKTVLLLLGCGAGAYNYASVPFLMRGTSITPAAFDRDVTAGEGNGLPTLINADWDPKTRTLDSFNKGRGIGDCGQSARYAWDGTRFRLIEERRMDECRGSLDWPRTWIATVR